MLADKKLNKSTFQKKLAPQILLIVGDICGRAIKFYATSRRSRGRMSQVCALAQTLKQGLIFLPYHMS